MFFNSFEEIIEDFNNYNNDEIYKFKKVQFSLILRKIYSFLHTFNDNDIFNNHFLNTFKEKYINNYENITNSINLKKNNTYGIINNYFTTCLRHNSNNYLLNYELTLYNGLYKGLYIQFNNIDTYEYYNNIIKLLNTFNMDIYFYYFFININESFKNNNLKNEQLDIINELIKILNDNFESQIYKCIKKFLLSKTYENNLYFVLDELNLLKNTKNYNILEKYTNSKLSLYRLYLLAPPIN